MLSLFFVKPTLGQNPTTKDIIHGSCFSFHDDPNNFIKLEIVPETMKVNNIPNKVIVRFTKSKDMKTYGTGNYFQLHRWNGKNWDIVSFKKSKIMGSRKIDVVFEDILYRFNKINKIELEINFLRFFDQKEMKAGKYRIVKGFMPSNGNKKNVYLSTEFYIENHRTKDNPI